MEKEGVTVTLLNGTSSAGKTSIAKALQQIMDAPYLHVPVDSFEAMAPGPDKLGELGSPQWQSVFNRVLSGFHHSVAALTAAGSNLIVDHVLVQREEPENWLTECRDLLAPFPVYFIGVQCPLEKLRRRERARGDRARVWRGRVWRGTEVLGCGAKRPVTACAGTRKCRQAKCRQAMKKVLPETAFPETAFHGGSSPRRGRLYWGETGRPRPTAEDFSPTASAAHGVCSLRRTSLRNIRL